MGSLVVKTGTNSSRVVTTQEASDGPKFHKDRLAPGYTLKYRVRERAHDEPHWYLESETLEGWFRYRQDADWSSWKAYYGEDEGQDT